LWPSVLLNFAKRQCVLWYRNFVTSCPSRSQGSRFFLDILALENVTDMLCRNVGNELPVDTAQHLRRSKT